MNSTNWTKVALPPVAVVVAEDKVEKQVIVPLPAGNRFYKLQHP